jgi:hypothetical protein
MTTRQGVRRWLIGGVVAGCLTGMIGAGFAWAKPGVVKTHDGRTLEGDVTEKQDGIVVTLRGIPTTIARENVDSIQYLGNVEDQYKEKLAALPKTPSARDRLEIARWLFDNKSYELARKETEAALQIDPNNTDANTLYTTIQSQLKLEHTKALTGGGTTPTAPPRPPVGTTPATGNTGSVPKTASLHKYLSADQINLLKQAEWPRDDNTVKIAFNGDVKRKYVASAQENAASFNALSPLEQAKKIVENGTVDERAGVRIVNDPAPMAEYKRTIQPMILTNGATAGCHGGPNGGHFFLYGTADSDAASYTNFKLLTQTTAKTGGATRMMLDRTYPDQSLIALWGLPNEISKVSHPEVKGTTWRPMFRSTQDPQYQTLLKWMQKLVSPEPNYGFEFSLDGTPPPPPPPGEEPKPATRATTRPAPRK